MNAFTIPEKSTLLEKHRSLFPAKKRPAPKVQNPVSLPGGSLYLPPAMMRRIKTNDTKNSS
jgi:hypothetical protein